MRDNKARLIIAKDMQICDCLILVIKCLAVRKTIIEVIQVYLRRIIIESDPQLGINSINGKTEEPKEI